MATYSGTIDVVPGQEYSVNFAVLMNDLGGPPGERVDSAKINGQLLGNHCYLTGGDYDCNFHDDCYDDALMTFTTSQITAEFTLMGESYDCDCNLNTFECFGENLRTSGNTPVVSMAIFTLTPQGPPCATDDSSLDLSLTVTLGDTTTQYSFVNPSRGSND